MGVHLGVGDTQIPYHDARAIALFFKVMKWWKPDAIDIVGDIDDQLEYSRFSDGTTDEFFNQIKANQKAELKAQEVYQKALDKGESPEPPPMFDTDYLPFVKANADAAREFYSELRKAHPKADIHSSLGNHDIRVFGYMDKKAPDALEQITPEFLWGLDNAGITWTMYDEPPKKRFGDIYVHHGNTTSASGLAVKGDIENYNVSLVRGHDHRGGVVYKSYPMTGQTLIGMGTGHMCDPSAYGLSYTTNPSWELGFGIGRVIEGHAHLEFVHIDPTYTCVVDGKVFKG